MDMWLTVLKKVSCLRQGEKKVCENCFCPIPTAWEADLTRRIMGLSLMMCTMRVRVKAIGDENSINIAHIPHPHPQMLSRSCASGSSWLHPPRRCSAECLTSPSEQPLIVVFLDALLNHTHEKRKLDIFWETNQRNQRKHCFIVTWISKEFCR